MRILFTGGGTGGHIFPIVAVARELRKIQSDLELFYIGPSDFDLQPLIAENIKVKVILAGKFRRYFSIYNFIDIFKILLGFIQTFWYLYILMPDVIFSKGGYGSVPVVIIGWIFRIPILIHESDTIPGLANKLAGKLAKRIGVSFEVTKKYFSAKKTALVGNPIRIELTKGNKEEGRKIFKIKSNDPVILIMGGSQGAQSINAIILEILLELLKKYEIIHMCGSKNYSQIKKLAILNKQKKGSILEKYHLFPFLYEEQLKHAYAVSDLVISRAGSGSIFEIAACGLPSIIIPLPWSSSSHQKENAFAFAKSGATIVIEEVNLTPHILLERISYLISHPELRKKMSECALKFATPEAGEKIAKGLLELAL